MIGYHRDPLERHVRHVWNTQSRWGIRRRNRIILWSIIAVACVIIGITLVMLLA